MRGDGVGELGVVLDLLDHADDLGRHLLVELHIVLELGDHRARQRLGLDLLADVVGEHAALGLVVVAAVGVFEHLARAAAPSTSTFTVPSGSFSSCSTLASVPTSKIASVAGSSSEAFFCVASRMNVSERITSSSALIDFSRPTNSGTIMCGKTTMSRSGSTG